MDAGQNRVNMPSGRSVAPVSPCRRSIRKPRCIQTPCGTHRRPTCHTGEGRYPASCSRQAEILRAWDLQSPFNHRIIKWEAHAQRRARPIAGRNLGKDVMPCSLPIGSECSSDLRCVHRDMSCDCGSGDHACRPLLPGPRMPASSLERVFPSHNAITPLVLWFFPSSLTKLIFRSS